MLGLLHADAVLETVAFFGALGVVESIQRAHQITGDTTDAMEGLLLIVLGQLHIFAVHAHVDGIGLAAVKLSAAGDVSIDLFLRQRAAGDIHDAHGSSLHILCQWNHYSTKYCDVKRYMSK